MKKAITLKTLKSTLRKGEMKEKGKGIKKAGLKPIRFEFGNFTTVTFYKKPLEILLLKL